MSSVSFAGTDERQAPNDAGTVKPEIAPVPERDQSARPRAGARSRGAAVIQTKLQVGAADDPHEREADEIADAVTRRLSGPFAIDDTPAMFAARIRRSTHTGSGATAIDDDTSRRIQRACGRGHPLPDIARHPMEQAFGTDFRRVRAHTGTAELNRRLQSKAFTVGNDIFFRDSLPDTRTAPGRRLLAHELTHTVQQMGASSGPRVRRSVMPLIRRVHEVTDKSIKLDKKKAAVTQGATIYQKVNGGFKKCNDGLKSDVNILLTGGKHQGKSGDVYLEYRDDNGKDDLYWAAKSDIAQIDLVQIDKGDVDAIFDANTFNPQPSDVKQGRLGDCFFLAALAAVVRANPQHIKQSMRPGTDGKVEVRFYSGKAEVWVSVSPTAPSYDGAGGKSGGVYARDAAWVQLFEKAYLHFGHQGKIGRFRYEDIESDQAVNALSRLTGQSAEKHMQISSVASQGVGKDDPWSSAQFRAWKRKQPTTADAFLTPPDIDTFMTKVAKPDLIGKMMKAATAGDADVVKQQVRREHIVQAVADATNTAIAGKLNKWLLENGRQPGRRGTGEYTDRQQATFAQVMNDFDTGKAATLASNPKVGRSSEDAGQSAGESMTKGLVGGHEYAVMGYWKGKGPHHSAGMPDPPNPELDYVLVYNPWGRYSRVYRSALDVTSGDSMFADDDGQPDLSQNAVRLSADAKVAATGKTFVEGTQTYREFVNSKGTTLWMLADAQPRPVNKPTAGESGTFWLELSDVTKRFQIYTSVATS